jgi:hypothetical protein
MCSLSPTRLVGIDDLIFNPGSYGLTLTYALHRGISDLASDMVDAWLMFVTSDFILANGSLKSVLLRLQRGDRLVASPSYCVNAEDAIPELKRHISSATGAMSIQPRDLAKLVIDHRHNTIRGKMANEPAFHIDQLDQFYWLADEGTLLAYQMPVAIAGLRPEQYIKEPNSYWDYGLMREFCPTAQISVIGDSDHSLILELRDKNVSKDQLILGPGNPKTLGERFISWVTPYQRHFVEYPLTVHAGALPLDVEESRARLKAHVDEILAHAPAYLPSHLDHLEWKYHSNLFAQAGRFRHLAAERDAAVARIRELEEQLEKHFQAHAGAMAEAAALLAAERDAAVARIRELEEQLDAERDAAAAQIRELERIIAIIPRPIRRIVRMLLTWKRKGWRTVRWLRLGAERYSERR